MRQPSLRTNAASEHAGAYKWWVVFMLWFVCFFNYADRQSISSVFPVLQKEFGFNKFQQGLIASAFMWVYAFCSPLAGLLGDRLRRKDLILGGCLFWSLVTATTGWCSRLWHFVTVRAMEGLGETFYFPASMSLVSDYHGRKTRSRAISFHQSSVYIGTIAGSWLGAWFAERHNWRMGFFFFGGAGMVLATALYLFLREPRRGQADAACGEPPAGGGAACKPLSVSQTLRAVFRTPTAMVLMAAFLGANCVAMILFTWMPTYLYEKFHFELTTAGLWSAVFIQLASALSVPVGGLLADRFARRLAGGRMLVQALGLLAGAAFVCLLGTTEDAGTLKAAMACFGLCKGFYDSNIFASLYDVVEPRARATAAGIMNTVGWAGGAAGPIMVGWLAGHGRHATEMANMGEAFSRCGLVYLAGAAMLFAAIIFLARRDAARVGGKA